MTPMPRHNPADLISHRGNAVLIDEVSYIDDDRIETCLVVRPGTAFSDANGDLPAWVGPEVMAQSIAALAGHRSLRTRGHLAPIGLLLGIRSYEVTAGEFRCGEALQVQVVKSSEDEHGMAVFDGRICHAGEVVASATLTVFQPPDDSFIEAECARND
jgi:predicted hotdog family 3-hydroxylacyl-ACP dehydratase